MNNPYKHGANPIKRNIAVFRASGRGFLFALKTDNGVRQWSAIVAIGTIMAVVFGDGLEIALMVFSLALVLVCELLNTALEETLDRISTDYDPKIGAAKDIGSAAVFLAAVIAVIVWIVCIFFVN